MFKGALNSCWLSLLSLTVAALVARSISGKAADIDSVAVAVVFLSDHVPVTETVNDERWEVWLKKPGSTQEIKKVNEITGTGAFIISHGTAYLVTAKHLAVNMTDNAVMSFQSMGEKKKITLSIRNFTKQGGLRWFHHDKADVSVYPLATVDTNSVALMSKRALALGLFETNSASPSRDLVLTTIGFPLGMGAGERISPLTRDSKAASGMLEDGGGEFFLLQDPSVSEYSGSLVIDMGHPVLSSAGFQIRSGAHVVGIMSGTFADNTGGKMAKVVPAHYVVELVRKIEKELNFNRE